MPQQLFVLNVRSVGGVHVHSTHSVLLVEIRILYSLNLLAVSNCLECSANQVEKFYHLEKERATAILYFDSMQTMAA